MADKNDGGDKTEKPTPQKLKDARKKGSVWKSKEITSTATLLVWLALGGLAAAYAGVRLQALMVASFQAIGQDFTTAARNLGANALEAALLLSAMFMVPVAAVGVLVEFLQAGPVLAFDKVKPKLENMNPVEGIKRMFTMDNLVEVLKAVIKTALLFGIGWAVLKGLLPQILLLARQGADGHALAGLLGSAYWRITLQVTAWTLAVFGLLSVLDAAWQRHSFMKKLRMSLRDIKKEMKDSEGDPHIKQQRRQTHQEWSQRNAAQAARQANVLVVNPTHVAIALEYDRDSCPIPTVSAKGEDEVARAMREAAEDAGVPIVRNVALARELLAGTEVGEIVPQHLFEIVAEVILWAREVREDMERQRRGEPPARRVKPPGEDATRYPEQR
ncbi:type III secretion system export apparatus subunit SctU [Ideonella sp. BN130291]|uniref:type III secretion system export apparatus subunit SctU n=1 Tax=Ideonella sp. BN130291 TaxID=3112940 RepID=UPI002E265846|nr:type III secretion system export apparatus subunit SctU [Ideonella sp. BN130291]